ncbi:hypothetical protein [Budvicia aquatica]|nr:hypothetical protein [Budvicia aquatica]VFS51205.1 Uncharacterised protein [Budvicia aquatica]
MKSLKEQLLTPTKSAVKKNILGADVFIRRLTAQELLDYDEQAERIRESGTAQQQSVHSVEFILNALVDADGNALPVGDLPSAMELLAVHDNPALVDALVEVQKHSVIKIEEAEKNS